MTIRSTIKNNCFTAFQQSISGIALPDRFNFPFYYDPHPLAQIAVTELQQYIETQMEWEHDFGLIEEKKDVIIGKMFGVLVVENSVGEIGYLSAFSGKLAGSNHHSKFVPPVFDMLTEGGFLTEGMTIINEINIAINKLEEASDYLESTALLQKEKELAAAELEQQKQEIKQTKKERNQRREIEKETLSPSDFEQLEKTLSEESIAGKIKLKKTTEYWTERIAELQKKVDDFNTVLNDLKNKRKNKSNALQKRLFTEYTFLNKNKEEKSLLDIFEGTVPMGGSGECAAPKLLQYAFQHEMRPITMAEFWWGQSPKSEIRKHKNFYPACQGKCKPILAHMLEGIPMDPNVLLENQSEKREIEILYEDDHLAVINKPIEFLSTPGRYIKDSVATRMKARYPKATGPLLVHRLDMSTSGIMLITKTQEAHKYLQYQFIKRIIKKRYVALLDGIVAEDEGRIDLPLRTDWDHRPMQMVCYESGRPAQTKWNVIERRDGKTRIHFFPVTGRTHQLRVHAAHASGLEMPIVGDDIYGVKGARLCLHAEWIGFKHPGSKEWMEFEVESGF